MNKKDIPLGRTGQILSGKYTEWQIRVEDDLENAGGFLVLISRDFSEVGAEGYDNWVEDKAALNAYFEEIEWDVHWP